MKIGRKTVCGGFQSSNGPAESKHKFNNIETCLALDYLPFFCKRDMKYPVISAGTIEPIVDDSERRNFV